MPKCYYQKFKCHCLECKEVESTHPELAWWNYYVCTCHHKAKKRRCPHPNCGVMASLCCPCGKMPQKPRGTPVPKNAVLRQADIGHHEFVGESK